MVSAACRTIDRDTPQGMPQETSGKECPAGDNST